MLTASVVREAGYRFRACFRDRRGGYLVLVLVLGLVGGVAMAAVAGGRRTQSSFPVYLASTNPGDVQAFTEFDPITGTGYSPRVDRAIARVRYVKRAVDVIGFDGTLQRLGPVNGRRVPGEAPPSFEGSPDGEYFTQDRVSLVRGRMADPSRSYEVLMTPGAAAEEGLQIGSALRLAFFTTAQVNSSSSAGSPADKPHLVITLKLVGIVKDSAQIVQDDDTALGDQLAVLTPALTRRLESCCAYYSYVSLQLDGGTRHEAAVVSAIRKITPDLGQAAGSRTSAPLVAQAERTIRPEAIAFEVFGLIAVLSALVISGQIVSRLVRRNAEDGAVLRALGAGPAMTVCDGLIGVVGAVVTGSLLAVAVAVGLSPLAPIGPVRSVYPDRGVSFDWTVLGLGFVLLTVVLTGSAAAVAYRVSPHRARRAGDLERSSRLAQAAAACGLPPTAVTGIRSALGSASGRHAAPVRSALLGAVIAVVVVVTSITFGSSLSFLVSRPALYGWNWDYALLAGFSAAENLPASETAALLNHNPVIAHWAGVYFEDMKLDGQDVPALASSPNAPVSPPLLSGHGLQAASQIVLGPATLAQLHKHLGDTVIADTGQRRPARLRIVGTATLPTIGSSGSPSLHMGTGAIVAPARFPAQALNPQGSPVPGPMAAFITIRPGVTPAAARRSLDQVTAALNRSSDGPVGGAVSTLRPAEIASYRTVGSTPSVLAAILAAGAIGALGLTLIASVRRRRHEFALLKTLGFTRRQLAATVAWHSSVPAIVGVIFGVPLGIAFGRWLWILFARGMSAVPDPNVPALYIVAVALGAIVFANLAAILPAHVAARTPTALLLRTE